MTHTNQERDPYWEVELSQSYSITRIVVWNRQEHNDWLSQATVELLDADRNVQATFQLPKEPENQGEGSKGPSFTFILPQSCTLVEGTYQAESNSATRPWWAFKPASCPSTGCPLFFWCVCFPLMGYNDQIFFLSYHVVLSCVGSMALTRWISGKKDNSSG